jgi:hypothetical protein
MCATGVAGSIEAGRRSLMVRRMSLKGLMSILASTGVLAVVPGVALGAPEAPVTEAASSVTSSSAVLNGTVNPSASARVGWYFAYSNGPECIGMFATGFGGEEEVQAKQVTGQAEGLEPDKTYEFCLIATNSSGEATAGPQLSFTTLPLKPSVDGQSSSNVTSTDAQLEALVNPNNQETTYRFLYATNQALTGATNVPGSSALSASYGDQSVSVDLGGALTPDTTYFYRVVAENAAGITEGPVQSFTTTAPPLLTIGQAQEVERAAGTITGTVDPAGLETTYYFQYGLSTVYGQNAPSVQGVKLAAAFGPQPVSIRIDGLVPGTTYHYRIVATNTDGATYSPDETFTTGPPTPPIVNSESASNITLTTATLTGLIDPVGLETSYVLELGTDTAYGTSIAGKVRANSENVIINVPVVELAPGTTYHYRFVAVNPDGRVYGPDQTFTTPVYEHPIVLPPTEPLLSIPAIAFPTETANTGKPAVKKKAKSKHKSRKRGKKHKNTRDKKKAGL